MLLALLTTSAKANTVRFDSLVAQGTSSIVLNPANSYIGGAFISRNLIVEGNGATIDLTGAGNSAFQAIQANDGATVTFRNIIVVNGPFACFEAAQAARLHLEGVTATGPGRGVAAREDSHLFVTNCTITGGYTGIEVAGPGLLNLQGGIVTGGTFTAVNIENAPATLTGGRLQQGSMLLRAVNAQITLSNCEFATGSATAMYLTGGGTLSVLDSHITNLEGVGIYTEDTAVDIDGLRITTMNSIDQMPSAPTNGTVGVRSVRPPGFEMANADIRGADIGVDLMNSGSTLTIADSTFHHCGDGIIMAAATQHPLSADTLSGLNFFNGTKSAVSLGGSAVRASGITATQCNGLVIRLQSGSTIDMNDSTFINCALNPFDHVVNLTNSTARLHDFHAVNSTGTPSIQAQGVTASQSSVELTGNSHVAGYGLGVHLINGSSGVVRDAFLENNGEGIYCDASTVVAERNRIYDNLVGQALQSEGLCDIIFRHNVVRRSEESGVGLNSAGPILIEDNYFEDLKFGGISVSPEAASPQALVRRNTVHRAGVPAGIFVTADNVAAYLNGIWGSTVVGIQNEGSSGNYTRNAVVRTREPMALLLQSGPVHFAHNLFLRNSRSFLGTNGSIELLHNKFAQTGGGASPEFAVFLSEGATLLPSHGNTFVSIENRGLWVTDPPRPNATGNWWGHPSGPNEDGFLGPGQGAQVTGVNFEPWLDHDPIVYTWIEGLSLAGAAPLTTDFSDAAFGLEMTLESPTGIDGISTAAWAGRENQTRNATGLAATSNILFLTLITDARVTIHNGTIRISLRPAFLTNHRLTTSSFTAYAFDDDTAAWAPLTANIHEGTVYIDLPSHAVTVAFASDPPPPGTVVDWLLAIPDGYPADYNADGFIDAADTL